MGLNKWFDTVVVPAGRGSRSEIWRLRARHTESISPVERQETLHSHAFRRSGSATRTARLYCDNFVKQRSILTVSIKPIYQWLFNNTAVEVFTFPASAVVAVFKTTISLSWMSSLKTVQMKRRFFVPKISTLAQICCWVVLKFNWGTFIVRA